MDYFDNQIFEHLGAESDPLVCGEYSNCTFRNCDFGKFNFSSFRFLDCQFQDCNLSLANLSNTTLNGILFKSCKMMGLQFQHCNDFGLDLNFVDCILDHSSFYQVRIPKSHWKNSQFKDADFGESDLSSSKLIHCNFAGATFLRTNLEHADLSQSYAIAIDPEVNRIKGAIFELEELQGLLLKYKIKIAKN